MSGVFHCIGIIRKDGLGSFPKNEFSPRIFTAFFFKGVGLKKIHYNRRGHFDPLSPTTPTVTCGTL